MDYLTEALADLELAAKMLRELPTGDNQLSRRNTVLAVANHSAQASANLNQ